MRFAGHPWTGRATLYPREGEAGSVRRLVLGLLLLLAGPAAAYAEGEAPTVDPRIAATWHEPAVVRPGQQWEGFLRPAEGANVTSALYQVCEVGRQCFAPPTAAERLPNGTFRFHTSDYRAAGRPVEWEAGWRVGVKWCLAEGGADPGSCGWVPSQEGDDPEMHYFAFDIPGGDKGSPAPALGVLAVALLAAAARRR